MTDKIHEMMQHLDAAKSNSEPEIEPCSNCARSNANRRERIEVVHHGSNGSRGTEQRLTRRVCPECSAEYSGPSY